MKNLAGETKADLHILKELSEAGIEIIEGEKSRGEVPYTLTGKLCDWNFNRAWYYWMAGSKGEGLPLEVATELHKAHGEEIRVNGYAGGIEPTGPVRSYHIDSQEGLNTLAGAIRNLHNMASSGTDSKEVLRLYDKISALYTEWDTEANKDGVEWLKKMPTILYGNGTTVNELIVAIKDESEVVSIAKKWQNSEHGHGGIAQHFFEGGQITGFNYGHMSGPGQILNRGPEVDGLVRPHYEEVKALRPEAAGSLELCLQALEKPGPEYTGRSDGGMTVKLAGR